MIKKILSILLFICIAGSIFIINGVVNSYLDLFFELGLAMPLPTMWILNAASTHLLFLIPTFFTVIILLRQFCFSKVWRERLFLWPEAICIIIYSVITYFLSLPLMG